MKNSEEQIWALRPTINAFCKLAIAKEGAVLEAWADWTPTNGEARILFDVLFQLQAGEDTTKPSSVMIQASCNTRFNTNLVPVATASSMTSFIREPLHILGYESFKIKRRSSIVEAQSHNEEKIR